MTSLLLIALTGLGAADVPRDETARIDTLTIGEQHFLRIQRFAHPFGYGWSRTNLAAQGDTCAVEFTFNGPRYVVHYDNWGNMLHEPVRVTNTPAEEGTFSHIDRHGDTTWVVWQGDQCYRCNYARAFDRFGGSLSEQITITEDVYISNSPVIARVGTDRVVFAVTEWTVPGSAYADIFASAYTLHGEALAELAPIAVEPLTIEFEPRIQHQSDGSLMIAYHTRGYGFHPWEIHLQRVESDYTLGEHRVITTPLGIDVETGVLNDGSIAVLYREGIGDVAGFVRRFDAHGQPLDDAVEIAPDWRYAAAAADRRVVVSGYTYGLPDNDVWIECYDGNWEPIGPRIRPVDVPGMPEHDFSNVGAALAYSNDGTIWLGCSVYEAGELDTPHLTILRPFEPGDMNFDGLVNNFDIDPFVLALTDPEEYQQLYPELPYQFLGDLNFDGDFNNFDIDPFVEALTGP